MYQNSTISMHRKTQTRIGSLKNDKEDLDQELNAYIKDLDSLSVRTKFEDTRIRFIKAVDATIAKLSEFNSDKANPVITELMHKKMKVLIAMQVVETLLWGFSEKESTLKICPESTSQIFSLATKMLKTPELKKLYK